MVNKDLGIVTAYAYAVSKGYTGTEEEFAELMADYANVGQRAEAAAEAAAASATAASGSASNSAASATAAEGFAGNASTAAGNASQAAQNASQSATAASSSATSAAGSATTAGASATAAQAAQTAAEAARTAAETAQEKAEDAQAAAEAAAQTLVIDPTLTQANQAAEAKATGDAIGLVKSHLEATMVTDTASGAIASFPDGSDGIPVEGLTVTLEPIQDLHGQANPYPGGTEANLFKATPYRGIYNANVGTDLKLSDDVMPYSITSDGKVKISITVAWRGRLFATDSLTAGTYAIRTYGDLASVRFTAYITDSDLTVKSLIYTQSSFGWSSIWTPSVSDGDRIAVFIGTNEPGNLTTEFSAQNGTVLNTIVPFENICPISGRQSVTVTRAGVNLLAITDAVNGGINADGSVNANPADIRKVTKMLSVKPNTAYYFWNVCPASQGRPGYWYDANGNGISMISVGGASASSGTATSPADAAYCRVCYIATNENICMMSLGTTQPTTYEAPDIASIEVQLGQTVYGGTVDVTTGEMVVDRAMVDLGTLSWNLITVTEGNLFRASVDAIKQEANSLNLTCDRYATVISSERRNCTISKPTGKNVDIIDNSYSDAATFKTAMSGAQLCYELATPITVQLTPEQLTTVLGQNNVWSDADSVSVDYVADTKLYVQKVISAAVAALS